MNLHCEFVLQIKSKNKPFNQPTSLTYFITQVETSWYFSVQLRGKLHHDHVLSGLFIHFFSLWRYSPRKLKINDPKTSSYCHNINNDESCQWDKEVFICKNNSAVPLSGKDCTLEYIAYLTYSISIIYPIRLILLRQCDVNAVNSR